MNEPSPLFKVGTIFWALLLGGAAVFLAGSIMLPSTKRAHFDFSAQQLDEDSSASAATAPTSAPAQP